MIWVSPVCLGLFGRHLAFEILEHLPLFIKLSSMIGVQFVASLFLLMKLMNMKL